MKTLSLLGLMAFATSVFAQGMDNDKQTPPMDGGKPPMMKSGMGMDSTEDVDYSRFKDYFFGKRRGLQYGFRSNQMEMPAFEDPYDEQVFKFLDRNFSPEGFIPARPFDTPQVIFNDDTKFKTLEKMANSYRRELIRDNEMRGMMMGGSMRMKKPMGGDMDNMKSGKNWKANKTAPKN